MSTHPRADRLLIGPGVATLLALAVPNIVVMLAQAGANFLEAGAVRPRFCRQHPAPQGKAGPVDLTAPTSRSRAANA